MIEEKPALLRLRVKVYLGILGISESNVWDEPRVIVNEEEWKRGKKPDIVVVMDDGIWWWEMKAHKSPVSSIHVKNLEANVRETRKALKVEIIRNDGQKSVINPKISKVTIICGSGGFSAPAIRLCEKHGFDWKKPEMLKVPVLVEKRVSDKECLIGVKILIIPKGSKETLSVPKTIEVVSDIETK